MPGRARRIEPCALIIAPPPVGAIRRPWQIVRGSSVDDASCGLVDETPGQRDKTGPLEAGSHQQHACPVSEAVPVPGGAQKRLGTTTSPRQIPRDPRTSQDPAAIHTHRAPAHRVRRAVVHGPAHSPRCAEFRLWPLAPPRRLLICIPSEEQSTGVCCGACCSRAPLRRIAVPPYQLYAVVGTTGVRAVQFRPSCHTGAQQQLASASSRPAEPSSTAAQHSRCQSVPPSGVSSLRCYGLQATVRPVPRLQSPGSCPALSCLSWTPGLVVRQRQRQPASQPAAGQADNTCVPCYFGCR